MTEDTPETTGEGRETSPRPSPVDTAHKVTLDLMEAHARGCRDKFDAACVRVLQGDGGGVRVTWDGTVTYEPDLPPFTVVWEDPPEEDT